AVAGVDGDEGGFGVVLSAQEQLEALLLQLLLDGASIRLHPTREVGIGRLFEHGGQFGKVGEADLQRLPRGNLVTQSAEELHASLSIGAVAIEIGRERFLLDRLYLALFVSQVKDAPQFHLRGAGGLRCGWSIHSWRHDMLRRGLASSLASIARS